MKKIYDIEKDRFLNCDKNDVLIITIPINYSYMDMEIIVENIKKQTSNENIIIVPKDINIESLSFEELKSLKEKIESIMVMKKLQE